jgi:hypothetical protein
MKKIIFTSVVILCVAAFYSCEGDAPDNWTEKGKYAVGASTIIKCGDSLEIKLSKGDSIFVHPEGTMHAGQCHVEIGFRHKVNGKTQNDADYLGDIDRWKIKHDSTTVKIKCIPKENTDECQFMLKAK